MPVEGIMNSKAYLPIIERKVSAELSKLHPQVIFQPDSNKNYIALFPEPCSLPLCLMK